VNLSTGDDVSKRRWRPREIPFGELEIVAPTWPGRLMHDSFTRARNGFRQVLPAYWRLVTRRER
jgi:hypothetical protein